MVYLNAFVLISMSGNHHAEWFPLGGREFYMCHFERICSWDLKYGGFLKNRIMTLETEMGVEWNRITSGGTGTRTLGEVMRQVTVQFAPQFPSYGQTRLGNEEAKAKFYEKKGGKD